MEAPGHHGVARDDDGGVAAPVDVAVEPMQAPARERDLEQDGTGHLSAGAVAQRRSPEQREA
jgi:hypothetical protein